MSKRMIHIPLDDDLKPLIPLDLRYIKKKYNSPNLGILLGNKSKIIAIEICHPFTGLHTDLIKETKIIYKNIYNKYDVASGAKPGYLLFNYNIDFNIKILDFTKFLFGFKILGNKNFIPAPGTICNRGEIYVSNNVEINNIDLEKFINQYYNLENNVLMKLNFYKQYNWLDFFKKNLSNYIQLSDDIILQSNKIYSDSGLIRDQNNVFYPDKIFDNKIIKSFCGARIIFYNKRKIISEENDGYYFINKYEKTQLTNWTTKKIQLDENGFYLLTDKNDIVYIPNEATTSICLARTRLAPFRCYIYTGSNFLINNLFSGIIQSAPQDNNLLKDFFNL